MKKKLLPLLISLVIFSACGDDAREDSLEIQQEETIQDSIPTLEGEFIYMADAAILKGENFIYGVDIDSVALDLAEKIRPFKEEAFDMIPVVVKAKIKQNPGQEGWDEIIEIREIIRIPESSNDSAQYPSQ